MTQRFGESHNCLNCGTPLSSQYCGTCGQRASSRIISLWELLRDAFGDLFELDSRLWRTLTPLVIRPGLLTRDYLRGRRARYMPPFRMYLVLSLVFFVVAFFNPRDDFSILFATGTDAELQSEPANAEQEADDDCDLSEFETADLPTSIQRRLTKERLQKICTEIIADDGRQLAKNLINNIPVALVILLPFMAFVLKILYPLARRYYVEHLLFVVHFHAFCFLILSLQLLFSRLVSWVHLPGAVSIVTFVVVALYIAVYLYRAMRMVYEQDWYWSLPKFLLLSVAYVTGFSMTLLGALSFAVFSI